MAKGYFNHPVEHALASKGIKTKVLKKTISREDGEWANQFVVIKAKVKYPDMPGTHDVEVWENTVGIEDDEGNIVDAGLDVIFDGTLEMSGATPEEVKRKFPEFAEDLK